MRTCCAKSGSFNKSDFEKSGFKPHIRFKGKVSHGLKIDVFVNDISNGNSKFLMFFRVEMQAV